MSTDSASHRAVPTSSYRRVATGRVRRLRLGMSGRFGLDYDHRVQSIETPFSSRRQFHRHHLVHVVGRPRASRCIHVETMSGLSLRAVEGHFAQQPVRLSVQHLRTAPLDGADHGSSNITTMLGDVSSRVEVVKEGLPGQVAVLVP